MPSEKDSVPRHSCTALANRLLVPASLVLAVHGVRLHATGGVRRRAAAAPRAVFGLHEWSWSFGDGRRGRARSCLDTLQQGIEDGARKRGLTKSPWQPPSELYQGARAENAPWGAGQHSWPFESFVANPGVLDMPEACSTRSRSPIYRRGPSVKIVIQSPRGLDTPSRVTAKNRDRVEIKRIFTDEPPR